MKFVKEMIIIFGITMVGELLNMLLPFPIPAGVYGLFILLGLLLSGLLKLSDILATGEFLLDLMPIMLVPPAVGVIEHFAELKSLFLPVFLIAVISTLVVMTTTGKTAELLMKLKKRRNS